MNTNYKAAGVDVEAGYQAVELMKAHVARTHIDGVLSGIGGFGGMFEIGEGYKNPVLVSGTDGVGTKLKIAFLMDKHDTIGQDCVAMCVNDILCCGAKPLFFLDYLALGKNFPEKVAAIVAGVAEGCVQSGCALIGGETAEMPGFYPIHEYDLAGFSVGIVDKQNRIDGSRLSEGDVLIGLASSGVHSNGYALIRRVFNLDNDVSALDVYHETLGCTLGDELLKPTKIYVKPMQALMSQVDVKAVSHITGGGFVENIPRMLCNGKRAVINRSTFNVLPIFNLIQSAANIPTNEMYSTYNMGIGMVIAVAAQDAQRAIEILENNGEQATIIGEIVNGEQGIDLVQ